MESHTLSEEALGALLCSLSLHSTPSVASWDLPGSRESPGASWGAFGLSVLPHHLYCHTLCPSQQHLCHQFPFYWIMSLLVMNHPMSVGAAAIRMGGGRRNAGHTDPECLHPCRTSGRPIRTSGRCPSSRASWPGSAPPTSATASLAVTMVLSASLVWKLLSSEHPVSGLVSEGSGHGRFCLRTSTAHPISPRSPQARSNPSVVCPLTNVHLPTLGKNVTGNLMSPPKL